MLKKGLVVALLVHESNLKDKAEKFSFSAAQLYAGLPIVRARPSSVHLCGAARRAQCASLLPEQSLRLPFPCDFSAAGVSY